MKLVFLTMGLLLDKRGKRLIELLAGFFFLCFFVAWLFKAAGLSLPRRLLFMGTRVGWVVGFCFFFW